MLECKDGVATQGQYGCCEFPFKYKDRTYNKCTRTGAGYNYWCATKTMPKGTKYEGQMVSWALCIEEMGRSNGTNF